MRNHENIHFLKSNLFRWRDIENKHFQKSYFSSDSEWWKLYFSEVPDSDGATENRKIRKYNKKEKKR